MCRGGQILRSRDWVPWVCRHHFLTFTGVGEKFNPGSRTPAPTLHMVSRSVVGPEQERV